MHFLDQAKIFVRSGAGGPGAVSFRREKFIEYGGPNGGNGGKGGDIIFEAVAGLNTLIDFRYTQHFRAPRGHGGSGSNMTGAGGEDLVIKVPVGTQILSEDKEEVLADFTEAGQREVFLRGGDGDDTLSGDGSTYRFPSILASGDDDVLEGGAGLGEAGGAQRGGGGQDCQGGFQHLHQQPPNRSCCMSRNCTAPL